MLLQRQSGQNHWEFRWPSSGCPLEKYFLGSSDLEDEMKPFMMACLDVTSHQHRFKLPDFGRALLAGQAPGLIWDSI